MSKALESFQRHYSKAQIYCGYQLIHQAATGAPHNAVPSTLFHAAHFVLTRLLQVITEHPIKVLVPISVKFMVQFQ